MRKKSYPRKTVRRKAVKRTAGTKRNTGVRRTTKIPSKRKNKAVRVWNRSVCPVVIVGFGVLYLFSKFREQIVNFDIHTAYPENFLMFVKTFCVSGSALAIAMVFATLVSDIQKKWYPRKRRRRRKR